MKRLSFRLAVLSAVVLLILSSCTNQRKVTKWLDGNRKAAAKYCAATFPVIEKTDTLYTVDSAGYEQAYMELWAYADSLLNASKDTVMVERIRESIKTEIKYRLKPCVDSVKVVTKTVINTAQLEVANGVISDLQAELARKDETISKRDDRISKLEEKNNGLKRWLWIGWLLFICLAVWCNRKLLIRLITKLPV